MFGYGIWCDKSDETEGPCDDCPGSSVRWPAKRRGLARLDRAHGDLETGRRRPGFGPSRIRTETFGALSSVTPGIAAKSTQTPHLPPGRPGSGPTVAFARSGLSVNWDADFASLLELAEACDVPVRWSCRTGACHTCETPMLSGAVTYTQSRWTPRRTVLARLALSHCDEPLPQLLAGRVPSPSQSRRLLCGAGSGRRGPMVAGAAAGQLGRRSHTRARGALRGARVHCASAPMASRASPVSAGPACWRASACRRH
jgi:ferredoxin